MSHCPRQVGLASRRRERSRAAFTLVELLVTITIIAMLLALLLPALQAIRERSRRLQCANNLKQTAMALHSYHHVHSKLPVGGYSCCWGTWQVDVLPYLEETKRASAYDPRGKYDIDPAGGFTRNYRYDWNNKRVTGLVVHTLRCPSDGHFADAESITASNGGQIKKHNYVVNYGNTGFRAADNGSAHGNATETDDAHPVLNGVTFGGAPFSSLGGRTRVPKTMTFDDIHDGQSNTLLLSEAIKGRGSDLRGYTWWGYATQFQTYLGPNSSQPDVLQSGAWGHCNRSPQLKNPPCIAPSSLAMPMTLAARSRHPGGVYVAMCDGSVHFVTDNIQLATWRALSTIGGGDMADITGL